MKSNRSLKEIHLAKHRFPDEKTQYIVNSPIHANSPSNYTLHVDQLASVLKNVNAGLKSVHRHDKSVQSQKNLDIPSIKFQLTSPKMHHHVKGFKEYHS